MDLNGKVAVITGAGSGLGEALTPTFARAGAAPALVDLDEAAALATLKAADVPVGERRASHSSDADQEKTPTRGLAFGR